MTILAGTRYYRLAIIIIAVVGALALVGSASAHFCFVENKPAGAGSAGTFEVTTETFTQTQGGGAFVTATADGVPIGDVFIHVPQGGPNAGNETIPPVAMGVQDNCDRKGLGELLDCGP